MTSSLRLPAKNLSTISCSLMGMENLKISTMLSMSPFLTNLPSLVTGCQTASSFFLSGRLPPFLSPPRPNPLFSPSGFGASTLGACQAITLNNRLMRIKKQYLSCMAVKTLAFHFLSALLAVLVVLANWLSWIVRGFLGPLQRKSILAKNLSKKWILVEQSRKRQILQYFQIILNLVLGLLFTKSLAHYHSFFIRTMVTISFQLHLLCLNWAVDLPDYSVYLNDSESLKMITNLLCLLFGYLGLSTQICFTLDLVSLISYPFTIFRRLCQNAYFGLLQLKNALVDILMIKRKYWVTCPHPQYLIRDSFKMVYICALPLIFSLIVLAKAYSLLMSTVIVVFKTVISIGGNLSQLFEEIGRIISTLAGIQVENGLVTINKLSFSKRYDCLLLNLKALEWVPVLKWHKIRQIFSDSEKESSGDYQYTRLKYVSIITVYQTFSNYLI